MARPRRHTKAFDADPGLEFEFFLAKELGMTVCVMRSQMPEDEYVRWRSYYARQAQRMELERLRKG